MLPAGIGSRLTILCLALGRQFIRNRLQDERTRTGEPAKSRLQRCESERQDDNRPPAIRRVHAVPPLVDGRDGVTMLGIGVAMVASFADYHRLVSIHRPLGILILILVVIRFVNRRFSRLPPSCHDVASGAFIASVSETAAVHVALCGAAGRLGDVVCGALSDRTVWTGCIFSPSFRVARRLYAALLEGDMVPRLSLLILVSSFFVDFGAFIGFTR